MRGLRYQWQMAWRRKTTALLVILFALTATVFLLFYPELINDTKKQREEAYKNIEVTGWILNSESYADPVISEEQWENLNESGYFSEILVSNSFQVRMPTKEKLSEVAGEPVDEQKVLLAMQSLLQKANDEESGWSGGHLFAYNRFSASEQLMRKRENMTWLEGYDESCLSGKEHICILSDEYGYQPGDIVPFLAVPRISEEEYQGIFRMKVVATYHGNITGMAGAIPLESYQELCTVATSMHKELGDSRTWPFTLGSLLFTVRDNYELEEIKGFFTEQQLTGSEGIRAVIDDRILTSTVSPIESNLSLQEGLYRFFFIMVAAIGFFISFLLTRGRKAEYAVMRLLGESRLQITIKTLVEQCVLCFIGVLLGAMLSRDSFQPAICATVLLCYTLGAAAAVLLTIRVDVLDILRDKE